MRIVRPGLVVLAVAGAVALTGCGSKGAERAGTAVAPVGAPATSAPPPSTPTPSAGSTPMSRPGLSDLASALGEQGRGAFHDAYGTLELENEQNEVALYVTDPARGRALVDAAKRAHPEVDTGRVRVATCPFSKAEIDRAMDAVMAAKLPAPVFSAAMAPHATGLLVETDEASAKSAAVQAALTAVAGRIPVTLKAGQPLKAL
ncbi:hypothetical protein [Streptomyces sp. TLI_171]|uniref:hypothetical protein n=1 Tax=Streptomyces sp. TLI_171 TaxID=1938859 RepID=UPI000C5A78AC|nr:hypothetical protein [Streptomyces sp. TLI_171]RKE18189.1 hypothetical protein BX266_1472 [Streptomyces sp. TLI_171]